MFCIRIAGIAVGIDNRYEYVKRLCRDYICTDEPRFCVRAKESDLRKQLELFSQGGPGYAESICVYRDICRRLPEYGAFVFHAAAVECDGASYAFSAPSGTGKSTHAALWLDAFGDRARIINGDKPVIRICNEGIYVCGTPWCGKEGQNTNAESPLRALCFIERGTENSIRSIEKSEAVMRIMPQILMPREEKEADLLFGLLDRALSLLPLYVLRCNISAEAAYTAYEGMKG